MHHLPRQRGQGQGRLPGAHHPDEGRSPFPEGLLLLRTAPPLRPRHHLGRPGGRPERQCRRTGPPSPGRELPLHRRGTGQGDRRPPLRGQRGRARPEPGRQQGTRHQGRRHGPEGPRAPLCRISSLQRAERLRAVCRPGQSPRGEVVSRIRRLQMGRRRPGSQGTHRPEPLSARRRERSLQDGLPKRRRLLPGCLVQGLGYQPGDHLGLVVPRLGRRVARIRLRHRIRGARGRQDRPGRVLAQFAVPQAGRCLSDAGERPLSGPRLRAHGRHARLLPSHRGPRLPGRRLRTQRLGRELPADHRRGSFLGQALQGPRNDGRPGRALLCQLRPQRFLVALRHDQQRRPRPLHLLQFRGSELALFAHRCLQPRRLCLAPPLQGQ